MVNPFKHSVSAIKIIKNDLLKIKKIINIVVQIVFFAYCLYLIFSNLDSIPYIITYSLILLISIVSIIIEPRFRTKEGDDRKEKRLKKKQRRIVGIILRGSKYLCKLVAIIVAIIEISTSAASDLSILATIGSSVLLLIQIIYDFVVLLVNKYIDILQIAIEEDIRSSKMLQFALGFANKKYVKDIKEDEKTYTEDERKILELLENDGQEEKKERIKAVPVNKELQNAYLSCKKEASSILENKKEKKALFKKVNSLELEDGFDDIPSIIEFAKAYKNKKYTYISEEKASSAVAGLLFLSKKDELPISKDDEQCSNCKLIIKKSLEEMGDEYNKFLEDKTEKKHFFIKKKDSSNPRP